MLGLSDTTILGVAALLGILVVALLLLAMLRKRDGHNRSRLADQILLLGFEPVQWDYPIRDAVASLAIAPDTNFYEGDLYHATRGDAEYILLQGFPISSVAPNWRQYSMLVISPSLDLPHMAMMPTSHLSGWVGRIAGELMGHLPLGSLKPVELEEATPFRLYAENPMQAVSFLNEWRLSQLDELSTTYVNCSGRAFMCSLIEPNPQRFSQTSSTAGLNRLFDIAQRLYSGLTR